MPKIETNADGFQTVRPTPEERALVRGMNVAAVTGRGNIAALHFDGRVLAAMVKSMIDNGHYVPVPK